MSIEAISLLNGKAHDDENKCINCGVYVYYYLEEDRSLERTELRKLFHPTPKFNKVN
jgi:hypothetical protein